MDEIQLRKEYKQYNDEYRGFQKEVWNFLKNIKKKVEKYIHIVEVKQRPNNRIKPISSIINNLSEYPDKYKSYKNIFDIKDIAGIRIVCHCEDDVIQITNLLIGVLKQEYILVGDPELKGENNTGKSNPSYKATHITVAKDIGGHRLLCEIQIRTVMADARAVQDRKYVYGKITEGEPVELTNAVSQIMTGCEQLRTLVKRKSSRREGKQILKQKVDQHKTETSLVPPTPQRSANDIVQSRIRFRENEEKATEGLRKLGIKTFMKVESHILNSLININIADLKDIAKKSTIETFGWPIGVYLEGRPECSPKPDNNGIHTEVSLIQRSFSSSDDSPSYDYWALNKDGSFYLKKSIFEDNRDPKKIFFNTRIIRITEVFMYIKNIYTAFGIPDDAEFEVTIEHGGLQGRILDSSSPSRSLMGYRKIEVDNVPSKIITTLHDIETNIVDIVEKFTQPLFEQFEFFQLSRSVLEDIVKHYVNGEVV